MSRKSCDELYTTQFSEFFHEKLDFRRFFDFSNKNYFEYLLREAAKKSYFFSNCFNFRIVILFFRSMPTVATKSKLSA